MKHKQVSTDQVASPCILSDVLMAIIQITVFIYRFHCSYWETMCFNLTLILARVRFPFLLSYSPFKLLPSDVGVVQAR